MRKPERKRRISEIGFSFTIGTDLAHRQGMNNINKSALLSTLMLLTTSLAVGCVNEVDAEDPIDEAAVAEGKEDAFGVRETDPEAEWVLRAANEMTYEQLIENGVGKRAAKGLVAARPFVSLADVDKVPYVGVTAFVHLLEAGNAVPASDGSIFFGILRRYSVGCCARQSTTRQRRCYVASPRRPRSETPGSAMQRGVGLHSMDACACKTV